MRSTNFMRRTNGLMDIAMRWRTVEIVSLRVSWRGISDKPGFTAREVTEHRPAPVGEKPSPLGGMIKLYKREMLLPGATFAARRWSSSWTAPPMCRPDGKRASMAWHLLLSRD